MNPLRRHRAATPATPGRAWCFDVEQLVPPAAVPPGQAGPRRGGRDLAASPGLRLAAVVVAVAAAYHYSLATLVRTLGLDTPLAYLGLVPLIALGLAALGARPAAGEPDIADRQVDFIVGLPLLAAALAVVTVLPDRMSTMFWYYRVDLLSLPLFVAGVVTLVFGVRTTWRLRFPIGFLLLAWPLPYTVGLERGLSRFTDLTLGALHALVRHVHVAVPQAGGDGSQFLLGHGAGSFTVSVASACAGVDGALGFLLVGLAFTHLVRGRRAAKALWLATGLVLVFALNLGRLLLIFWAGSTWGEAVAIDGLHPYIGLVLFCLGVAVMVAAMPLFGLRVRRPERRGAAGAPTSAPPRWVAGSAMKATALVVTVSAAVLASANGGMSRYSLVAGDLGAPRLAAFDVRPATLHGWSVSRVAEYDWTKRFFGRDSSWVRYQYVAAGASAPGSVLADVVTTRDLGRFSAYGIESCYRFHGFGLHGQESFDLGGGVRGRLVTFRDPKLVGDWDALYWVWAVRAAHGTRYERVVLLAPDTAGRRWLRGFARDLVRTRAGAPAAGVTSASSSLTERRGEP